MNRCIVIELTDGTRRIYAFPDEESAASWYAECRTEWNAGRSVVFQLPRSNTRGWTPPTAMHDADQIHSLYLADCETFDSRGSDYRNAVLLG